MIIYLYINLNLTLIVSIYIKGNHFFVTYLRDGRTDGTHKHTDSGDTIYTHIE